MSLRIFRFELGPGKRPEAEIVAETVVPFVRDKEGCERCEFFADYAKGDYGVLSIWASEVSATDASAEVEVVLNSAMKRAGGATVSSDSYDLYEPRQT